MITEQDLREAIAECLGQREPNANTCIKLAAFYTIRREMFGGTRQEPGIPIPSYSNAAPSEEHVETHVEYTSDTEFSKVVNGSESTHAWSVIDELMETLKVINPRLYNGVLIRMEEG